LDTESAFLRLSQIAQAEGIDVNKPVLDALISTSSGDLRRAITYLQSASRVSTSNIPPTPILPAEIQEIAGVVPDAVINDFAGVLGIDVDDAMDTDDTPKQQKVGFDSIRRKVTMLMREGYSASQIISQVRLMFS
jgi:replication factor C subunit 2/4